MLMKTLLTAATGLLLATGTIAQTDHAATAEVKVRLISPASSVQPGQKLLLALEQRIAPHWHTYWINPGDSGQATSIDWSLPAGAKAGPIQWPTPERIDIGPLSNYGYSEQVLLLSEVQLPADLKPGSTARLSASVSWLVCKDVCIPQEAELALSLPVAAEAAASADAPLIEQAKAALPAAAPWPVQVVQSNEGLLISWPVEADQKPVAQFFAGAWGQVRHASAQALQREGSQWRLLVKPGETPLKLGERLEGLLVLGDGAERRGYQLSSVLAAAPPAGSASGEAGLGLLPAILLALLGGLVLNLMPCVFPVLSIKAFSLVQQAHGEAREARQHGLAYTAGVLASFAVLAGVLVALRAAGGEIGWGLQFQSPLFVLGVAWLLFGLGLSLSGLLDIGAGLGGLGSGLASKAGLAGSFFSGVLAAVVATPCTAPFMGAAIAFALAQPAAELLAVFLSLGLGLALPYLLLSWWPALQRLMPRPGAWMNVLKQGLAFPMYGAAIWLTWVLAQQQGPQGVLLALSGMALIALAAWLHGISRAAAPRWKLVGGVSALASLALAAVLASNLQTQPAQAGETAAKQHFEPYTPERLAALRGEGKPVFINLTAAWCISCLVNERVALSSTEVRTAFAEQGINYLKGDWTHQDPKISALLAEHGRSGVPLYLFYAPGAEAQVLPQLLTPGIVLDALREAKPPASSSPSPTT
ncbi:thioredoxin family protein [Pelomonas sp. V22]|uniref:protein-disulfide reductase DsbD family protein n=1 Tax=Pelomonas sp. V22 TaxID=2822139 RepID=UPI0024A7B490|nr:protein-disulfide reductase DsbD domain-containing protein [Pelomonas sp. V22]MDI4633537.1 thioredoxin family protein [Pelomonas sp. V22]